MTDRDDDWTQNYRVPDVAVMLNQTACEARGTHLFGPVDSVIEIVSPGDRTYDKLDFYSKIGVRELLVLDRDPWALKLYRHDGAALTLAADLAPGDGRTAAGEVLPLRFQLEQAEPAPVVVAASGTKWWRI